MWLLPKQHGSAFENNQSSVYCQPGTNAQGQPDRLDAVLDHPAYNFMLHTSPVGEEINDHYHWHFEIIPKLTKVAGFEWGTGFYICPTPPEESARFLREAQVTATHISGVKLSFVGLIMSSYSARATDILHRFSIY